MKKLMAVLAVAALVLGAANLAQAHGPKGEGGHGGNHGGYGGGSPAAAVSAPAVSTSPADAGAYTAVEASGQGKVREQIHVDSRSCDPFGDITVKSKQDGSFTYGGLEFHLPTYAQCMKDKGYRMGSASRNDLTNFGQR